MAGCTNQIIIETQLVLCDRHYNYFIIAVVGCFTIHLYSAYFNNYRSKFLAGLPGRVCRKFAVVKAYPTICILYFYQLSSSNYILKCSNCLHVQRTFAYEPITLVKLIILPGFRPLQIIILYYLVISSYFSRYEPNNIIEYY